MDKLSMEVRLLIAFLLVGVVLTVSQFLAPAPAPHAHGGRQAGSEESNPVAQTAVPRLRLLRPRLHSWTSAGSELTTFSIDTTVYKVVFSNRGATVHN
ncbi:MAG: hypothetical protein WDO18_07835 [Acidobacteriota bacterium]